MQRCSPRLHHSCSYIFPSAGGSAQVYREGWAEAGIPKFHIGGGFAGGGGGKPAGHPAAGRVIPAGKSGRVGVRCIFCVAAQAARRC